MSNLKIPEIGQYVRNVGKIVRVEEIPQPTLIDYIIEEESARCELRIGNYVINKLGTFNDFYGIDTCKENAIKEMKEYCEELGITKDSELEVVVIHVLEQHRARPTWHKNFYSEEYTEFRPIEWGSKRDVSEDIENVVWSSKKDL